MQLPADEALPLAIWAGGERVTSFSLPALGDGNEWFVVASGLLGDLPRFDTGFALFAVASDGTVVRIAQDPVVYALHASPNGPGVDVYAGASELVDNLEFSGISGAIQVPPGMYTLDVYAHEEGTTPSGEAVLTADTPMLEAGERYLAVATGFVGSNNPADEFRIVPVVDEFGVDPDNASLRFMHGSPDTPAVDVGTVAGSTLTPVFTNVAFGETSDGAGVSLPADTYAIGASVTGSTTPVVTFTVPVAAGDRVLAIAAGALSPMSGEVPLGIIAVDTAGWPWGSAWLVPN